MTQPGQSSGVPDTAIALKYDAGASAAGHFKRRQVLRWVVYDAPVGTTGPLGECREEGFLTEAEVFEDYECHRQPGWPDLKVVS